MAYAEDIPSAARRNVCLLFIYLLPKICNYVLMLQGEKERHHLVIHGVSVPR